jgi:hypothetical protein
VRGILAIEGWLADVLRSCKGVELSCKLLQIISPKPGITREVDRPGCIKYLCSITMRGRDRKGKPAARRGRKAYGPLKEVAGLPNRQEQHQVWDYQEWEPSDALTSALGNVPLQPGTNRDGQLAGLEPHLREALMTLEDIERKRGLSGREKTRAGALRMLLASIERTEG